MLLLILHSRFAAKEAAFKAHPHRRLRFHEISIHSDGPNGRPYAVIAAQSPGEATNISDKAQDGDNEGQIVEVSISHDGEYATAVVLAIAEQGTASERDSGGAQVFRKS
jgi:holo-[acyl-carrier protein] synthase